ncbi:ABC transporter permease [Rhodococcus sp. NPDC127528]|uniref:ABC transporter permease n=1 Tax=unclassified Rhodococcus (in: high G+C Gram-positive bacteria) TaxID=192944 RepID=UPI00363D154E
MTLTDTFPVTSTARETGLIFWSHLRASLRNPLWVLIGLSQPILYLVLFGPLLEGVSGSVGAGTDPWLVFTPGLIIQIGLFGSMFAGFSMVYELRAGIIERQRVTPASRSALLLGRVLKDMVVLMVQATILVLVAVLLFDLRPNVLGFVLTLVLVAIIAAGMSSASYALALATRSEDSLASVLNMVSVPLLLLSGILLPMTLGPGWLQTLARINPLSHTVDAARALFRGDFGSSDVYVGTAVTVVLAVVLAAIGARTFAKENA